MKYSFTFIALGALSSQAKAQYAAFTDMTWGPFTQGMNYTIGWTLGNGATVSANLWSGNYSQPVFTNLPAASSFIYTIPPVAEGSYSMRLLQGSYQADESPIFSIFAPAASNSDASSTVDAAAVTAAASSTVTAPSCTGSSADAGMTEYVYFDEVCGCNKTALAPGPTAAAAGGMNYTVPAMVTSIGGVGGPKTYMGAASTFGVASVMTLVVAFFSAGLII